MRNGQSDEPFTIRDIQFDDPQIGVLNASPRQIVGEVLFVFSIFCHHQRPSTGPSWIGQALKKPRIRAVLGQHDKNRSAIAFTLVDHRRETTGGLNLAQQARNLKVRREPRFGQLGRVTINDIGEQAIERLGARGLAQRSVHPLVAHHSADRGQCVKVRRAGLFG